MAGDVTWQMGYNRVILQHAPCVTRALLPVVNEQAAQRRSGAGGRVRIDQGWICSAASDA